MRIERRACAALLREEEHDGLEKNRRCGRGVGSARLSAASGACGRCGAPDRDRTVPEPGLFVMPAGGGQCRGDQRPRGRARALRSRSITGTGSAGRTHSPRPPGRRASTPTPRRWATARTSTRPRWSSTVGSRATVWSRARLAGLMSRGDRGAGGPSVGFSGGAVTVGAGGGAGRRRGRLACALYSAHGRGHDPARRECRPHSAL